MKKRSVGAIVLGVIAILSALLTLSSINSMTEFILDEVPSDVEEMVIMLMLVMKGLIIVAAIVTALCVVFNTKKGANVTLIVFGILEICFGVTFFVGLFSIISGAVANSHINKVKLYEASNANAIAE